MAEPAEQYYPSDSSNQDLSEVEFGDEEIPGQDALWEPPAAARSATPGRSATPADYEAPTPDAQTSAPRRAGPSAAARGRRPSTDGLGITGRGVVVLITAFTALVGVIDVIASGNRGPLFGVAFVIAAAACAYLVRRRDLLVSVVAPPLIYCVLIAFMSLIDSGGTPGGITTRLGVYIGDAFATGAPSIWLGTAVAAAISWWRAGGSWNSAPPAVATKLAAVRRTPR